MTDVTALEKAIVNAGLKKAYIANTLGISRSAFWKKSNNFAEFTASEIDKLKDVLELSTRDVTRIFFAA